jgi:hypothetical protein
MEEKQVGFTAQEMDFIVGIIKQLSVSPAHQDAISIISISQSILSKIAKACKEEECQQESTT